MGKVAKNNITNFEPQDYTTLDLLTKYKYSDSLELSLGISNILDATYYQYQNIPTNVSVDKVEQYREAGRSIQAGFKFTF